MLALLAQYTYAHKPGPNLATRAGSHLLAANLLMPHMEHALNSRIDGTE